MSASRFAVFGAGGIGGYFAAVLTRAGFNTAIIARGQNLEAIRRNGLRVESAKDDFTVRPAQVSDNPQDIGPVDAIILGVKAWQVPDAARALGPLVKSGTKVLPLENGVEAPEQLEQALGREHTLVGMCRIISSVVGPGHIHDGGMTPTVDMGEPDDSPLSPNARILAEALTAAGAVVQTPPDIRAALWEKFLFIAAVSATGAVSRATIGQFRECPPTRHLLQQLMAEVAAVAHARGISLSADVVARTLAFVDSIPATGTASMQRDLADGKPSELEAIVGAVVRFGEAVSVATPAMRFVYASLLPQEQRARKLA
jgi:2-dehydropantoate 2-reductase